MFMLSSAALPGKAAFGQRARQRARRLDSGHATAGTRVLQPQAANKKGSGLYGEPIHRPRDHCGRTSGLVDDILIMIDMAP